MCFFIDISLPGTTAMVPARDTRSSCQTGGERYRHRMRPFTAIVVIGLLILIIGAFVAKLIATGLTP